MTTDVSDKIQAARAALAKAMQGTVNTQFPDGDVLDHAHQTAMSIVELLAVDGGGCDAERYSRLNLGSDVSVKAWLLELPSFLALQGRAEQGVMMCDQLSPLFGAPYLEAERAFTYLEANNRERAAAHMAHCRETYGEHAWVAVRSAAMAEREGDLEAARQEFERALELARTAGDREDLQQCYQRFAVFLREHGETEASADLVQQMLQDMPELQQQLTAPQLQASKAPGRNDPCSCGSGKKFKKCCGKAS